MSASRRKDRASQSFLKRIKCEIAQESLVPDWYWDEMRKIIKPNK